MSIHYAWDCGDWPDGLNHKYEDFLGSNCKKSDLDVFSDEELEVLEEMVGCAEEAVHCSIDDQGQSSFEIISCDRPIVEQMIKCRQAGRGFAKLQKLVHFKEGAKHD